MYYEVENPNKQSVFTQVYTQCTFYLCGRDITKQIKLNIHYYEVPVSERSRSYISHGPPHKETGNS